jgi:hypothetical protein
VKNRTVSDGTPDALSPGMRGYITEKDFEECEAEFPGICDFYRRMRPKAGTFLELMFAYLHHTVENDDTSCGTAIAAVAA